MIQLTIPSPLGKNGEGTVDGDTVAACPVFEEGRVIPKFLVGAVEVEELLVFGDFELDPRRIAIVVSVPFCEHSDGSFALVVDEKPPWTFRNSPSGKSDHGREEQL